MKANDIKVKVGRTAIFFLFRTSFFNIKEFVEYKIFNGILIGREKKKITHKKKKNLNAMPFLSLFFY